MGKVPATPHPTITSAGVSRSASPDGACFDPARRAGLKGASRSVLKLGLEVGGDSVEGAAQVGADRAHDGNGCYRDQSGDETVFDCGHAVLVLQQTNEECEHLEVLRDAAHHSILTLAAKNEEFLANKS